MGPNNKIAMMKIALVLVLVLVGTALAVDDQGNLDPEYAVVRCGSIIKLEHAATKFRLHSHEIPYGSGSGQQSVTAVPNKDDTNSLWYVRGPLGQPCDRGTALKDGDQLRLQHVNTRRNLHSHLHRSPLSGNPEDVQEPDRNSNNYWRAKEGIYFAAPGDD